jgi:leucyl-tRNA synthetase
MTIAVQVQGKLRGAVAVPVGTPDAEVIAMAEAEPAVARLLEGRRIVKRIHVPGRIVNLVLG